MSIQRMFRQQLEEKLRDRSVRQGECLVWTHNLTQAGYGSFSLLKRNWLAHRIAHEMWIGEIPEGHDVHHKCENRACIEPTHLESLSRKDHLAIGVNSYKTHCKRNHEFTPENTIQVKRNGVITGRSCRQCMNDRNRIWMREYHQRKKEERTK